MITDIIEGLCNAISDTSGEGCGVPCSKYKGELEEGAPWNPVLPIAFVQVQEFESKTVLADNTAGKKEYKVIIMCADKTDSSGLAERLFDFVQGGDITDDDGTHYLMQADKAELVGYVKSVEIHRINIRVF